MHKDLYENRTAPYYIYTPAYTNLSGGIRAMHTLCHALNMAGKEAYVMQECTTPDLRTPVLTEQIQEKHFQAGLNPVIVYPEVVKDNPLKAQAVARYLLNVPGFLTNEAPDWGKNDIIFTFAEHLVPPGLNAHLLELPLVNTRIYNTKGAASKAKRKGTLLFINRFLQRGGTLLPITEGSTEISYRVPLRTPEELAELYKRAELMYTYEPSTACYEAIMCGCPVVYIQNDLMLPEPFYDYMETLGSCWGTSPSDINQAKTTVARAPSAYKKKTHRFWLQLEEFIFLTQERAKTSSLEQDVSPLQLFKGDAKQSDKNSIYATWRARKSMQEIDAEVLAERMMCQWTTRPGIHLLMALHAGEENLLANTLDSLALQLYPEWLLTVVTKLPPPKGLPDVPNVQWLSLKDAADVDYVINEMAAASPGAWLTLIEPGLVLEPQALQVVADYVNLKPDWQLIYTDEDTLEEDGRYTQPCFKPDCNLDLLRAQAYFGSFIAVRKDAFLSAGRYGCRTGAETYDLSLRIIDQSGEQTIGHISQMLVHLPRASRRVMQPEAERAAVADHLARRGLVADVLDGTIIGTRRIHYNWPESPLVSIVIQTRDREEYLRPLLDSLKARTHYPHYEIVVVDNDSSDPDALAWLAALPEDADWIGRCRVVRQRGEFNWSAGANTGADAAHGDFLLFLDNDTHIVQEEWLDHLMSIAQRPEVGIVAPRLTYPETAKVQQTGWILGLRGTANSAWDNDLELYEPGYMGRALCDQQVGAASGSALLVRRSVFNDLAGFDAIRFPLIHGALDFCLRAAEKGARTVWTPSSVVVHYNAVSLKARQRRPKGALSDILSAEAAHDALLTAWLPRLARDPAYNINLSLSESFKAEYLAPIDWDVNFHDRPRILGVPLTGGAGEYRLRAPLRAIGKAGLAQTMICEPPKMFSVRVLSPIELARAEPDSIILHQPLDDTQTDALEAYSRFTPLIKRIITIDDLVTAVPEKNSFYKAGFKDARPRLRRSLSLADRLVVSTRPLADLCADMIEDVRIMPNCLERELWGDVLPPRLPRRKPRVGWAGAQQHLGDLELIYPVVEALAEEVDWIFMGMCPPPLKPFVKEFHNFELDFRAYPKALSRLDLDLAIAPLEVHAFNEAKSNLRLLEYGAMGWPVICTDIYPYQNAPVTCLPNIPDIWIRSIREHVAEPDALQAAGQALKRWVMDGFILESHVASWFAAYGPSC